MTLRMDDPAVLHEFLDRAARRRPDAPAMRDMAEAWTYRRTVDASRRIAGWLARQGVRRGDRILIRHPNAVRVAAIIYGASRLGAVAVPVSAALSRFQLRQIVADAEPVVVLTPDGEAADLRAEFGSAVGRVMSVTDAWIRATAEPEPSTVDSSTVDQEVADPDGLALLMYTSGSTAAPKGVMCTHRQITFAVRAIAQRLRYTADDAVLCRSPVSFDYGLYQLFLCAEAGSELLLLPDGHDAGLLRWIRRWNATVVPLVPSLATMLVQLVRHDTRPTAVRLFTNTGAALDPPLAAALRAGFPGARLCVMFGLTECKRVSIMEPDGDLVRPGSVGRPLDGTRVLVVDDAGRPLPAGEVGEFVVLGPHVTAGYWRAEQLTRDRFRDRPDGGRALHTGDHGHVDADGYLYFAGRRDEIFKRKGFRVSAVEIEAAAVDIPGVRAAAVVVPGADGELVIHAIADIAPVRVIDGLRQRLEPAKVPDRCEVVADLPVGANGKVDKARLAAAAGVAGAAAGAVAGVGRR